MIHLPNLTELHVEDVYSKDDDRLSALAVSQERHKARLFEAYFLIALNHKVFHSVKTLRLALYMHKEDFFHQTLQHFPNLTVLILPGPTNPFYHHATWQSSALVDVIRACPKLRQLLNVSSDCTYFAELGTSSMDIEFWVKC